MQLLGIRFRQASLLEFGLLHNRQLADVQEGDDFFADAHEQLVEQVEGFEFVDQQRVFLLVGGVLHALLEVVHSAEMLFPGVVDDGEGDALFERETHLATLGFVAFLERCHDVDGLLAVGERDGDVLETVALFKIDALDDRVGLLSYLLQFLFVVVVNDGEELVNQDALALLKEVVLLERRFEAEGGDHGHLEAVEVLAFPGVGHHGLAHIVNHLGDVDGKAVAEECVAALAVDGRTLRVHHVVVLQQTFTDAEVVLFDLLLSTLDGLGYHAVLDDIAVLVAHLVHDFGDSVGAEQTHEVVFEGDEELGAAGVALTTGTAAQLTVNTT